jgi:hypothetical protein
LTPNPDRRAAAPLLLAVVLAAGAASAQSYNDYPTEARADYVFGCMAANGEDAETLRKCSCSIDHIASILPYEAYVQAETVLRTIMVTGERVAAFRGSARHQEMVADLRRAQAEADMVCFQ